MIRIGHMSDLHGDLREFFASVDVPDVWIVSGDFFPNNSDRAVNQVGFQENWVRHIIDRIIARFAGKPVLWVGGNHDFICLVEEILRHTPDYPAYKVTPDGVEVNGIRFAGFREINYIRGEWAGETDPDMIRPIVEQTFTVGDPQILITHAPPAGIMCDSGNWKFHYGVTSLMTWLERRQHQVVAHFFGHAHAGNGQQEEMGIRFFNGSNHVRFHDVEV